MRLLVTTPYPVWPESSGGARRTLGIARALAFLGHDVTLLGKGNPLPDDALGGIARALGYTGPGRLGHFFNPSFMGALDRALARGQDLVLASFPYQSLMLTRACRSHRTPLVYDAHNLETERFARIGNPLVATLVDCAERHLVRNARAVLSVSEADRQSFVVRYGCTPTTLPNGIDTDSFSPGEPDPALLDRLGLNGRRVALFVGSFDYRPNRHALDRLLDINWPIRTARFTDTYLLVVGRKPPNRAFERQGVIATGEVADIVPYLRLAHLALAPLSSGGGTRLKIVEALACGLLVLSTEFAAAGLSEEPLPGVTLCGLDNFPQHSNRMLETQIDRGRNSEGQRWALALSWRSLVGKVDWQGIARGQGPALLC